MLWHVAGKNAEQVARRLSIVDHALSTIWPNVRRFYEDYMQEQWDLFVSAGRKAVSPQFTDPGTAHGRESEAYRAVAICTLPATDSSFGGMLDEFIGHMRQIFVSESFRAFAVESVASGDLQREQRRIWDCECLLIKLKDLWILPGILM